MSDERDDHGAARERPIPAMLGIDSRSPQFDASLTRIEALYATNRRWVGGQVLFGSDFADPNHGRSYETGSIEVHKTGSPPAWAPDLKSIKRHPSGGASAASLTGGVDAVDMFLERASPRELAATGTSAKSGGLVFIHGYAFPFVDVFGVVGQMTEGYGQRNILSFCWPSYGDHFKYKDDQQQAHQSGEAAAAFFSDLLDKLDALGSQRPKLDLIVHSMGHRVLSAIMKALDDDSKRQLKVYFDHAILMAADEDYRSLSSGGRLARMLSISDDVNVYTNGNDGALLAGALANGGVAELGAFGPSAFPLGEKVVWLDAADVALDDTPSWPPTFGHQYFRLSRPVMRDVRAVLKGQAPSVIDHRTPDPDPKLKRFKFKISR